MTTSPEQFKKLHPHFKNLDNDQIGFHLEQAEAQTDEATFGASYERAVVLLAAHFLSMEPRGQKARLRAQVRNQNEEYETTYLVMYRQLMHLKTIGGRCT